MIFLNKHNLLSENQFAFRDNVNTENALCRVTENIVKWLDCGSRVVAIFLDLAKAFDTVAHEILLSRLHDIGIRGLAHDLFRTYLSNRTQKVKIANVKSDSASVEVGVPQGTVLGPMLFSIYMNGIFSVLNEGRVFCFADDSVILVNGDTWVSAIRKAESAITLIKRWLDFSLLSLNIDKTHFMTFALTQTTLPEVREIAVHDYDCDLQSLNCKCRSSIKRKESLKYLGVFIDENLTWKTHIEYVTTKIRKLIYKFYELRNILPTKILKTIYLSLVESVINYGVVVWGNARKNIKSALNVAQKYLIKIMYFKNRRYSSELLFHECRLLTVDQIYLLAAIRFMLKTNYYKREITHELNTRNVARHNVIVPLVGSSATQRHLYFVGPKIYNLLPTCFRTKEYFQIKNKLKEWLIDGNITINIVN